MLFKYGSSLNFRKKEFLISNGILFHIFGPKYFNGEDADVDHTQIIGGDTVKLLRRISPLGFGTPGCNISILPL